MLAAYRRWAGRVPPMSMQVLAYMAVVSKDKDAWPWFRQGQEALAEFAMGRANPTEVDRRAVTRAMSPLLAVGAITVDLAATYRTSENSHARYRLNITAEADAERKQWEATESGRRRSADPRRKPEPQDGKRPMAHPAQDPSHRTFSGEAIGRNSASHRTFSGEPWDGNRPTKESEDYEEREDQGINPDLRAPVTAARDPDRTDEHTTVVPLNRYRPQPPWSTRAADTIAEATARRAAARTAAQETT